MPIYVLLLNDMRSAQSESVIPAVRSTTLEALFELLKSERVDAYSDGVDGECNGSDGDHDEGADKDPKADERNAHRARLLRPRWYDY